MEPQVKFNIKMIRSSIKPDIINIHNVSSWLQNFVSPQILSPNRDNFLRQKDNNEMLSAALIAAVTCFKTSKPQRPGYLSKVHDNTDCIVIDKEGHGNEIQVVSTWSHLDIPVDVNAFIYKRIKLKNNKYKKTSVEQIHLCVFVGQQYYKEINLLNLQEFIKNNSVFANYWLIVPTNENNKCQFYVCDVFPGTDGEVYECIVDFTPPGPIKINFLTKYLENGQMFEIDNCFE